VGINYRKLNMVSGFYKMLDDKIYNPICEDFCVTMRDLYVWAGIAVALFSVPFL